MMSETLFQKSRRTKGYGIESSTPRCGNNIQLVKIDSLKSYIDFITGLELEDKNPIFYRGHYDANFLLTPTVIRNPALLKNEGIISKEYMRRFPAEFSPLRTNIERLAFMQHYGLYTRILDVSENPLVALFFACCPNKKFSNGKPDENAWGEVVLFKGTNENEIKFETSPTSSIISSCAFLPFEFSLVALQIQFRQDGFTGYEKNFIKFKDIISSSSIVRIPQNNPHIKNQAGAFILVNGNKVSKITKKEGTEKADVTPETFMKEVFKDSATGEDFLCLGNMTRYPALVSLKDSNEWDFTFQKLEAYSLSNPLPELQNDTFDINRLRYKNKDGKYFAVVIPSEAKKSILSDLAKIGVKESFIYPDLDYVANEMNLKFAQQTSS